MLLSAFLVAGGPIAFGLMEIETAVQAEYGATAQVADWDTIKSAFAGNIGKFCDAVGLSRYRSSALCTRGGKRFYSRNRQYFMQRHNGRVPGGWLVHDHIDSYTLSLGSWTSKYPILVQLSKCEVRADFSLYGTGCAGTTSSTPKIGHAGWPILGKNFEITLSAATPSKSCLLHLGSRNPNLDLRAIGAQGCTMLASIEVVLGTQTNLSGAATTKFTVPTQSSLIGSQLYSQYAVLVRTANTLGITASEGGQVTVGTL